MENYDLQPLQQAYGVLAKLYVDAWGNSVEVPTPVALMLLHARDYLGAQIHSLLQEDEYTAVDVFSQSSPSSLPMPSAANTI